MNKIFIKNFGAIKQTEINVKPLTVFTGQNSSGKSFVARLIHALNTKRDINQIDITKYLNQDNEKVFNKLEKDIENHFKNSNDEFEIPKNLFMKIFEDSVLKFLSLMYEEIIESQFEEKTDDLINFKNNSFVIKINDFEIIKQKGENLKILLKITDDVYISKNQTLTTLLNGYLSKTITEISNKNSYYIPAERSEIIIDKKTLSRRVKNESDLTKNQSDVLSEIIGIDNSKKGPFYELGCEFDMKFSGIIIDVMEKNFINDITYTDFETKTSISSRLLSTSIHEMTLFSIYLKYIVKPGDLLIIEEPEAHLHPKNQNLLLKYIIKSVNQGLNILITTHSDYISDQLNNSVRLNNISQEKLTELNYTQDDIIKCNDLSIYNFKKIKNYEFATEQIDIDETGFFEENFSKIIDELYEETVNITNSSLR